MEQMNEKVVVVLHEIYGINRFMEDICTKFKNAGFDIVCPNMIGRLPFSYEESLEAYDYFTKKIGFDSYKEIWNTVNQLKDKYEKVFLVGFSVGATLAWRCCDNALCDGMIGCYGSRIRDYMEITPACPTLLLFSQEESFHVTEVMEQLQRKPHVKCYEFQAKHGFIDSYAKNYDKDESNKAEEMIFQFLSSLRF